MADAEGLRLFPAADGGRRGPLHGLPRFPSATPADRPYLALNMVASVDGRTALRGSAVGLGSSADQRLMRELRAEADVLLHGAGTVRTEPMSPSVPADLAAERTRRGRSAQPGAVVVSASGRLSADRPYFRGASPDWPRVVYVPPSAVLDASLAGAHIEVRRLPGQLLDLVAVLADLHQRGVRHVLCEGGPTLNAALLAADLVDDVFLTLAPLAVGGVDPLTLLAGGELGPRRLALRSVYERDAELFLRYATR